MWIFHQLLQLLNWCDQMRSDEEIVKPCHRDEHQHSEINEIPLKVICVFIDVFLCVVDIHLARIFLRAHHRHDEIYVVS